MRIHQPIGFVALVLCLTACTATPTAQPALTPTSSPVPSATATTPPTNTPAPTETATLTPTPAPAAHPLSIAYLQQQTYNAQLVTEQRLSDGLNYHQYIVSYQSEGNKIYALLTVPFGETPPSGWPVIVFNHGYIPPAEYRTTERYVDYVIAFASHGYIVLRPDYRGHGDSEGVARGVYGTPDYVIDVLNATAAVKAHAFADPDRVGMWGHSMGGYITLRAMLVDPDIRAAVIWGGVVGSYGDMCEFWFRCEDQEGRGFGSRGVMAEQGTPSENPDFWDAASATTYLSADSTPLQLHHGTADTTVPIQLSRAQYATSLAVGHTVELYEYPGGDHNLAADFYEAVLRSIGFFEKYVKGEE